MPEMRYCVVVVGELAEGEAEEEGVSWDDAGSSISWVCSDVQRCWCWRLWRIWRVFAVRGLEGAGVEAAMRLVRAEGWEGLVGVLIVVIFVGFMYSRVRALEVLSV